MASCHRAPLMMECEVGFCAVCLPVIEDEEPAFADAILMEDVTVLLPPENSFALRPSATAYSWRIRSASRSRAAA